MDSCKSIYSNVLVACWIGKKFSSIDQNGTKSNHSCLTNINFKESLIECVDMIFILIKIGTVGFLRLYFNR